VEQTLGEISARAEELHLLAYQHRRYTARYGSVIAPRPAHDFIAFKLNGACIDGHLSGKAPELIGQPRRVPDRQIGLRRGSEVVESLQKTKARLRHQRPAIVSYPTNRLGDPGRIACEQIIVFRCSQEANDAQLDYEVVDNFLGLLLGETACRQVALE